MLMYTYCSDASLSPPVTYSRDIKRCCDLSVHLSVCPMPQLNNSAF